MFTTEFKLKPKTNLKLFAIVYDLRNLKDKNKPYPRHKSFQKPIVAIVNAANHVIYGGKITKEEIGSGVGGVSRAIVEGLHYLVFKDMRDISRAENVDNTVFKVLAELSTRERFPNDFGANYIYPYKTENYTLYDKAIMYDSINDYISNVELTYRESKNFEDVIDLPSLTYQMYLIHVAGPNFNHMNIYNDIYLNDLKLQDSDDETKWKTILERTLETLMECVKYLKITDLYLPLVSGNIYAPNKDSKYSLEVHAKVLRKYSHLKLNVYIVDHKQDLLDISIKYLQQFFDIQQLTS
jgi:hypothetical protein